MINKYGDIISGIFFFLLAVVYTCDISSIQIKAAATVDAAFIPRLLAVSMLVLSALIVVNGVTRLRRGLTNGGEAASVLLKPVLFTLLLLFLYVSLLETAGFSISTVSYLFLQVLVLSPRRTGRDILWFAVLAVGLTLLLRWLFVNLLMVMLPEGILFL